MFNDQRVLATDIKHCGNTAPCTHALFTTQVVLVLPPDGTK